MCPWKLASIVASLVLVPSNVTVSLVPGTPLGDQLAAVLQLLSAPPPVQTLLVAKARGGCNKNIERRVRGTVVARIAPRSLAFDL